MAVVQLLPELNRLVLCYLIHFLQVGSIWGMVSGTAVVGHWCRILGPRVFKVRLMSGLLALSFMEAINHVPDLVEHGLDPKG